MSIEVKNSAAQGDVLFQRVDAVPERCVRDTAKGPLVVAHSETGHHHSIHDKGVEMWRDPEDPMTCFLSVADHANVVHHRPHHTHETIGLGAGTWKVRRQREYTPEGWRRVQD